MNFDKPRWTHEEDARLLELSAKHIHQVEIGIRMGRTECAVRGRLARIRARARKLHESPTKRDKEDAERLRKRGYVCRPPWHHASTGVNVCSPPPPPVGRCTRISPRRKTDSEVCRERNGPERGGGVLFF